MNKERIAELTAENTALRNEIMLTHRVVDNAGIGEPARLLHERVWLAVHRAEQRAAKAEADAAALREELQYAWDAVVVARSDIGLTGNPRAILGQLIPDLRSVLDVSHPGASLLAVAQAAAALVEANGDAQYDALRTAVETWRKR